MTQDTGQTGELGVSRQVRQPATNPSQKLTSFTTIGRRKLRHRDCALRGALGRYLSFSLPWMNLRVYSPQFAMSGSK